MSGFNNWKEREKKLQDQLKNPKLIKQIIEEIKKEGVVGEEDSIAILILKISLRLVKDATATSSNILVSDFSGGGKDYLIKSICEVLLTKNETYYHRTDVSDKVLNYWINDENGEPIDWNNKILYLEDPRVDVIKSQAFKVRASGANEITVLKDQEPITVHIEGKPVIIVTSMKTSIDVEGTRRWDCIRIDTGEALTKAVLEHYCLIAAGLKEYTPDIEFRRVLKNLQRVNVIVPFAPQLLKNLPKHLVMRTQIQKLIDYIKASAALHQFQRERDKKNNVIATYEDYEYARFVFLKLENFQGEALNKTEQRLINYLRIKKEPVKINTIIHETQGITQTWLSRHVDDLVEREIVKILYQFDADANREVQHLSYSGVRIEDQPLKRADKMFNAEGYWASGQFYKDLNELRKKDNLIPLEKVK